MTIARRWLVAFGLAFLVTGLVTRICDAQPAPAPAAPPAAQTQPPRPSPPRRLIPCRRQAGQGYLAQPHPQHSGYHRLALGTGFSLAAAGYAHCGCDGWLGGARAAPALAAGAAVFRQSTGDLGRWPACLSIYSATTTAAVTASACRAGAAGSATRPRRWALRCCLARRFCCSSTGLCAAGRAATGWGLAGHAAAAGARDFRIAAA